MANHSDSRRSNKGSSGSTGSGNSSRMKGGQRLKEKMSGAGPSGARSEDRDRQKGDSSQHSHAGNTGFSSGQISPQAGSTGGSSMPRRSSSATGKERDQ